MGYSDGQRDPYEPVKEDGGKIFVCQSCGDCQPLLERCTRANRANDRLCPKCWRAGKFGEEPEAIKPLLGVMPRRFWLEARVRDLADAVGRAIKEEDRLHEDQWKYVAEWSREIAENIAEIARLEREKKS